MRYLVLLLLSSCAVQVPVWEHDAGVKGLCQKDGIQSYTHRGETKEFNIHRVKNAEAYCKTSRTACIRDDYDIYVTKGYDCPRQMAHELSHGFGMDFVDFATRPVRTL